MALNSYLPEKGITIISGYVNNSIHAYVAAYILRDNDSLTVSFPKGHTFKIGQFVTLHLDNRTGVDEYDADLRVYRTSYRGRVNSAGEYRITIKPDEYMLFYSDSCVSEFRADDFQYVREPGRSNELPHSNITSEKLVWNDKEHGNKLGVLITSMKSRPHTSLMAFLSDDDDDVFLITFKGTFKSKVLHDNNRCCFAIDHRADYNFEKALDWNYTIIEADAFAIDELNPVFSEIKYQFVEKNPWEASFFLSPEIEMFHIKPRGILTPECMV